MMRALLALLIGVWAMGLGSVAVAQSGGVPVRAVEHPEYSRLVLPLPPGVDYALSRDGTRTVLRLSGDVPDYDVSGVFDRMPRTRILAVGMTGSGGERRLHVTLACSCAVELERIGSGFLAIDVRRADGPNSGMVADGPGRVLTPVQGAVPSQLPNETAAAEMPSETVSAENDVPEPAGAPAAVAATDDPDAQAGTADDPVALAQAALLQQLTRAADAGLLALAPEADADGPSLGQAPDLPRATPPVHPSPDDAPLTGTSGARPEMDPPPPPVREAGLSPHLSVRVPMEDPVPPTPDTPPEPPACVADAALDVRTWGETASDLGEAIGARRRAIVDNGGRIDPAAVAALARLYVSAGFGREAGAVLAIPGAEVPDAPLLRDLAKLVEGGAADPTGPVAAATDCVGRVTLWRAAAGIEDFTPETPTGDSIRKAMLELPPRLRRLVGQEVARHALLSGNEAAAKEVIGILDRTPGVADTTETLVRAGLELAAGRPDAALAMTNPLVRRSATPDPRVLNLHAQAILGAGGRVTPALLSAIDAALLPAPAESSFGRALRIVRARLDAVSGRPLPALAALRALPREDPRALAEIRAAGRGILAALSPEARRSPLGARAVLENAYLFDSDGESRTLRLEFARALTAGGLPNVALQLLGTSDALPDRETRILIAQASLRTGIPSAALAALDGLSGEDAARLRAEANLRNGNVGAAYAALEALAPDDTERNTLALLSGRWGDLRAPADLILAGGVADYALDRVAADPGRDLPPPRRSMDVAQLALTAARGLRDALAELPESPANRPVVRQ